MGSNDSDELWVEDEDMAMQVSAYTAISEELEEETLGVEFAEAAQLAYAATNTLSQTKGKGKGKDEGAKGKSGGKVVKSNLTIADRKAKVAELKSKSKRLRCGVVGQSLGRRCRVPFQRKRERRCRQVRNNPSTVIEV